MFQDRVRREIKAKTKYTISYLEIKNGKRVESLVITTQLKISKEALIKNLSLIFEDALEKKEDNKSY